MAKNFSELLRKAELSGPKDTETGQTHMILSSIIFKIFFYFLC